MDEQARPHRAKGRRVFYSPSTFPIPQLTVPRFIRSNKVFAMAARLSSKQDYENLLDKYDTWLFDCDGVLWEGDRLIDGATEVLGILRRLSMFPLPHYRRLPRLLEVLIALIDKRSRFCSSRTMPPSPERTTRRSLTNLT